MVKIHDLTHSEEGSLISRKPAATSPKLMTESRVIDPDGAKDNVSIDRPRPRRAPQPNQ